LDVTDGHRVGGRLCGDDMPSEIATIHGPQPRGGFATSRTLRRLRRPPATSLSLAAVGLRLVETRSAPSPPPAQATMPATSTQAALKAASLSASRHSASARSCKWFHSGSHQKLPE
jgi:hypothetical protein